MTVLVGAVRVCGWRDRAVVGTALFALSAGFGQFGVAAALGDVATSFGHHVSGGGTLAEQAGLSGTSLGAGLAIVRLASLGAVGLTGLGDRFGRRPTLVATCALGLALTVTAAASPSYWFFVAAFALGRPFLTATATLAQVTAAELTGAADRARAISLVAAGYGVGAGLVAVLHSLGSTTLGFRGVFALAVVPLVLVPRLGRLVAEPDRFQLAAGRAHEAVPVLGAIAPAFRRRLALVAVLIFGVSSITGPANTLFFVYAQNVVGLPGAAIAAIVVAAGGTGFVGLVVGRWLADHAGRRPTCAAAIAAVAFCGCLAYSGSTAALIVGYVAGVFAGSTFAPAAGAFVNELFPTAVRASIAGWQVAAGVTGAAAGLVVFGAVADAGNRFGLAALVTFLPAVATTVLLTLLPETKGLEPEDVCPTGTEVAAPAP